MSGPELRDIHLPPDPGWWPPAPGWWFLAALATVTLLLVLRAARRLRRRRDRLARLRRELDRELAQAAAPAERLACLSALLRRWALARRPDAASLTGQAWLDALDAGWPDRPFATGAGRLLIEAPFQRTPPAEGLDALESLVRRRLLEDATHA